MYDNINIYDAHTLGTSVYKRHEWRLQGGKVELALPWIKPQERKNDLDINHPHPRCARR